MNIDFMNVAEFHSLYGHTIPMALHADLPDLPRGEYWDVGRKYVTKLESTPEYFNIPDFVKTRGCVYVHNDQGSFFRPHRDIIGNHTQQYVRLNAYMTNAQVNECTYIIGEEIQRFEERRWYIINPRLTHMSMTWKDNAIHYIVDIDVSDSKSYNWLYNNMVDMERMGISGKNTR